MICQIVLLPLIFLLTVVTQIARQIATTVCSWVSSVFTIVETFFDQVCKWMPWPLDKLCDLVKRVVTTIQTVWDWVCNTVIEWVFDTIEQLLTFVIYITRIICIIVMILIGLPGWLLCMAGVKIPMRIRICIKVITDDKDNSLVTAAAIQNSIDTMTRIYATCGIDVQIDSTERIAAPDMLSTPDSWTGFLTKWHSWFTTQACGCCNQVTVFFVDKITGGSNGLTYWGDNWCRVDASAISDPTIMAHEVGHVCSLTHADDNNNLMFKNSGPPTNPRNTLTDTQCCWMRMSPFVTAGPRG